MSDGRWPMCGRPPELSCADCADVGRPCYCDGPEDSGDFRPSDAKYDELGDDT